MKKSVAGASKDFVLGWGYKINDFDISRLWRWRKASEQVAKNTKSKTKPGTKNELNDMDGGRQAAGNGRGNNGKPKISHDLNLRFDFSIRNQNAIKRDLQTNLCEATSGSKAFKRALKELRLDPAFYLYRERPLSEVFPWDHLDMGFMKTYIRDELQKAAALKPTLRCFKGCHRCGVC